MGINSTLCAIYAKTAQYYSKWRKRAMAGWAKYNRWNPNKRTISIHPEPAEG